MSDEHTAHTSRDNEVWVEREEWEGGEFVKIYDSDYSEDEEAALLPDYTADEVAVEILKPKLRDLIGRWREGQPDDPYRRAIWNKRNRQRLECANELEELIEDAE